MANKILVPAPDVKEIVVALKERYPQNMQYVDASKIEFWRDMAPKKEPEPGQRVRIAYVRCANAEEITKDPNKLWHFTVVASHYDNLMPAHQHAVCFHESQHIGPLKETDSGGEAPTAIKHDVEEFYVVLATFGLNYLQNDTCRDLLGDTPVELVEREIVENPEATSEEHFQ